MCASRNHTVSGLQSQTCRIRGTQVKTLNRPKPACGLQLESGLQSKYPVIEHVHVCVLSKLLTCWALISPPKLYTLMITWLVTAPDNTT